MRISTKYEAKDWHELTFQSEDEWHRAIDIFVDRIRERFLKPIDKIETCEYAGFAVMALDCLLIEMLQQFRMGYYRTPTGQSKNFFVNFLTETSFGKYFDERKATLFYRQIRCGILHQAELRGSSKILIDSGVPLVQYSSDEKGLIVNRKSFHKQLTEELISYVDSLKEPSNTETREKFLTKMKSICKTACEIV